MSKKNKVKTELTPDDAKKWFHPLLVGPNNGEIVIIACHVDTGEGKVAQIIQSAVYEQKLDGAEVWHCGQPFVKLLWWLRLPPIPKDMIMPVRKEITQPKKSRIIL